MFDQRCLIMCTLQWHSVWNRTLKKVNNTDLSTKSRAYSFDVIQTLSVMNLTLPWGKMGYQALRKLKSQSHFNFAKWLYSRHQSPWIYCAGPNKRWYDLLAYLYSSAFSVVLVYHAMYRHSWDGQLRFWATLLLLSLLLSLVVVVVVVAVLVVLLVLLSLILTLLLLSLSLLLLLSLSLLSLSLSSSCFGTGAVPNL